MRRARAGGRNRGAAIAALLALVLAGAALARAEVVQKGNLRVAVSGKLSPRVLPRSGAFPVTVSIGGRIATTNRTKPPQLSTISIAINRKGRLDPTGLPVCSSSQIQPSTSAKALVACRRSLVGEGSFSANVEFPQQSPFPSVGKVLAFNGRIHGRPVILAHVYGTEPVPTSYTLPFMIRSTRGTFGTTLTASLPKVTGEWGFITGIQMVLHRTFHYRGTLRSYLSAACPAPKGFSRAVFPLLRASFGFAGHKSLTQTLTRTCGAR